MIFYIYPVYSVNNGHRLLSAGNKRRQLNRQVKPQGSCTFQAVFYLQGHAGRSCEKRSVIVASDLKKISGGIRSKDGLSRWAMGE